MAKNKKIIKKNYPIKKKKCGYRKRKRNKINSLFIFLIFIIIILASFVLYTVIFFPKSLSRKIHNDIISVYIPMTDEQFDDLVFIKLSDKPDFEKQKKLQRLIKEKYDIDVKFEKIDYTNSSGLNKIDFYKNKKKFKGIDNFFIFWDNSLNVSDIINKYNLKESAVKKKEQNKTYAEENNSWLKQEKLEKETINKFNYCRYAEDENLIGKSRISIIIDDVGYSYNSTYDFLSLGFPVNVAIIPDLDYSKKFYNLFKQYKYPLMLHIPMEPLKGVKYVEKNALTSEMPDNEIKKRIKYFLSAYPDIIGANNHMGSKIISDYRIMNLLINELNNEDKIWVDSRTALNSISKQITEKYNRSYYERDVFLDNNTDRNSITASMNELVKEAKENGTAIGIGHAQTKELAPILKEFYENREKLKIEFVPINKLK